MKKAVVNAWFLMVALMVSFSWLLVFPSARSGLAGDITWGVLAVLLFGVLRLSSGPFKRFAMFVSLLSICAGLLTLVWPAHFVWPDFVPDFFRIAQPGSDTKLFLLSFFLLFFSALGIPPVRRLLGGQRNR